MDSQLRTTLVDCLLKVPAAASPEGRDGLLGGLGPFTASLNRSGTNARTDLERLVDQLAALRQSNGPAPMLTFIDNAVTHVRGTAVGEKLLELRQVLSSGPADVPSYQLPQASSFDLSQLVEACVEKLLDLQGLVGLAVVCDAPVLLDHFCARLRDELGRGRAEVRPTVSLMPYVASVEDALSAIRPYKRLLATKDILCPVHLPQGPAEAAALSDRFWQGLLEEFKGPFRRRLIVLFLGLAANGLPGGVILLPTPRFTPAHVFLWVRSVVEVLRWPADFVEEWRTLIVTECTRGEELRIVRVYNHLQAALRLLQEKTDYAPFRDELLAWRD
jgi:hypothetical protein